MIRENFSMHSKVLERFTETAYDTAVPVNIEIGARHKDFNGDTQVDVLLEYEEQDRECVSKVLGDAINDYISIF